MTPSFHMRRSLALLAALLVAMCLTPQSRAQGTESATAKAYQDAKALYDNGKVAEALAALQAFESQYRFSAAVPQVIYLQGWCWAELQKYHEAINTFDRLIEGLSCRLHDPRRDFETGGVLSRVEELPDSAGVVSRI